MMYFMCYNQPLNYLMTFLPSVDASLLSCKSSANVSRMFFPVDGC